MTFQELHNEMDLALDRVQSPYFDSIEKDTFLNQALDDFMSKYAPMNQRSQEFRDYLGGLTRVKRLSNTREVLMTDLERYRRLLGMTADFNYFCKKSGVKTERTVPVAPSNEDKIGVDLMSPFQLPTDQFPFYRELVDFNVRKWEVLSRSQPLRIEVSYLANPSRIDGTSDPNGTLLSELPIEAIRIILERAISLAKLPQGDYQGLQARMATINN